ncbi:MAG: hypothetical protein DLM69_00605 [Candidatus Chloroheliales bacterium]|nr:MAG: hypothetical protein DLM69_00605 [Chloroflexota bacterium]
MASKTVAGAVAAAQARVERRAEAGAIKQATAREKRTPAAQSTLLRLTALRLVYQAIRMVEDVKLCEAGLPG